MNKIKYRNSIYQTLIYLCQAAAWYEAHKQEISFTIEVLDMIGKLLGLWY